MADQTTRIRSLGFCKLDSPYVRQGARHAACCVEDDERILVHDRLSDDVPEEFASGQTFEVAGPRRRVYFEPATTTIGVVTCGGLCPGLNDVIRGLVMVAWHRYGVRDVHGFRHGYRGIADANTVALTPDVVGDIHEHGGTLLGTSRGGRDVGQMVNQLERLGIDVLFAIGGDGTIRGARAIVHELERRKSPVGVIGIPKTIDNDIAYVDESFGFGTAYSTAMHVIKAAHEEARGAPRGVAVVKLMGRHSGFIACHATLACSHVNFALIPEVAFRIDGEGGFLESLVHRLDAREHAVVVVAEGAGQEHLKDDAPAQRDASGNVKLRDIGPFLVDRIRNCLVEWYGEASVKYIDPSYTIRSVPATAADSVYCWDLAKHAVHAGMSGKTEMIVSQWHGRRVHVPMALAVSERKLVDPYGDLWLSVLESTGQPDMA